MELYIPFTYMLWAVTAAVSRWVAPQPPDGISLDPQLFHSLNLLVHLVDMSHPRHDAQIAAVESILASLGDEGIPRLVVFNKADLLTPERRHEVLGDRPEAVAISAAKREGLGDLLHAVDDSLMRLRKVQLA